MRTGKCGVWLVVVLLSLSLALAGCGDGSGEREKRSTAESSDNGGQEATVAEGESAPEAGSGGADCSVTMGWDPWEPYQFENENGQVRGLDVELVRRIADAAGCSVSLHKGNWEALLNRLRHGDLDLLTGASRTEQRTDFARFSKPYREENFVLYVRADERHDYDAETLAALLDKDFRVGITSSYYYGERVSALQGEPEYSDSFVPAPVSELNYSRLLDHQIDGFLEDPFVATTILRKKGLEDQITEYPITMETGPVHLMFSRESVGGGTVERFNKALAELKATGTYDKIVSKYRK